MSLIRDRFLTAALTIGLLCLFAGCGRDESEAPSADTSSGDSTAAQGDDAPAAAPEEATAPDAPADADATPAPTGPTRDVAIAPSVDGEPMKGNFVFYTAKDNAKALADFHKKDLEAKGWKLGRNDTTKLAGTTSLSGAIQQYEKGSDVLTVLLTEQLGEGTTTSVCVMDIPLPPATTFINGYGGQGTGEITDTPDASMAWLTKELTARGWTADKPQDAGGTRAVNFRKGQRTLSTQFRDAGGARKATSFYFMHMGY
jgi:hypothetical protein